MRYYKQNDVQSALKSRDHKSFRISHYIGTQVCPDPRRAETTVRLGGLPSFLVTLTLSSGQHTDKRLTAR